MTTGQDGIPQATLKRRRLVVKVIGALGLASFFYWGWVIVPRQGEQRCRDDYAKARTLLDTLAVDTLEIGYYTKGGKGPTCITLRQKH